MVRTFASQSVDRGSISFSNDTKGCKSVVRRSPALHSVLGVGKKIKYLSEFTQAMICSIAKSFDNIKKRQKVYDILLHVVA